MYKFSQKKSLGQHFLKNKEVLDKISKLENLANKLILEIGPGKVLSGLIKRIDRNVKLNQVNNLLDIKNITNDIATQNVASNSIIFALFFFG